MSVLHCVLYVRGVYLVVIEVAQFVFTDIIHSHSYK